MSTLDARKQDAADAALATLADALRQRQAGVKGALGRYRSCLLSRDWGTWEEHKPDAAVVTAWVGDYLGPDGVGYLIYGEVTDGGERWQRRINAGPETYRTQAWTLMAGDD